MGNIPLPGNCCSYGQLLRHQNFSPILSRSVYRQATTGPSSMAQNSPSSFENYSTASISQSPTAMSASNQPTYPQGTRNGNPAASPSTLTTNPSSIATSSGRYAGYSSGRATGTASGVGSGNLSPQHQMPARTGATAGGCSTGRQNSVNREALASVGGVPVKVVDQIVHYLREFERKETSNENILDVLDKVNSGQVALPELPPSQTNLSSAGSSSQNGLTSDGESSVSDSDSSEDDGAASLDSRDSHDEVDTAGSQRLTGPSSSVPSVLEDQVDGGMASHSGLRADTSREGQTSLIVPDGSRLAAVGSIDPSLGADSGVGPSFGDDIETDAEVETRGNETQQNVKSSAGNGLTEEETKRLFIQNTLFVLQKEFEILDASRKCSQCKIKSRDTTFLPCGHFMMCKECSEPVYTCPACSKAIQATAQTYLS